MSKQSEDQFDGLSKKLATFASSLDDQERALLHHAVTNDRGLILKGSLTHATGGRVNFPNVELDRNVPNLDATYFKLLCW